MAWGVTLNGEEIVYNVLGQDIDEKFDITKKVMAKLGIKMPEKNKK